VCVPLGHPGADPDLPTNICFLLYPDPLLAAERVTPLLCVKLSGYPIVARHRTNRAYVALPDQACQIDKTFKFYIPEAWFLGPDPHLPGSDKRPWMVDMDPDLNTLKKPLIHKIHATFCPYRDPYLHYDKAKLDLQFMDIPHVDLKAKELPQAQTQPLSFTHPVRAQGRPVPQWETDLQDSKTCMYDLYDLVEGQQKQLTEIYQYLHMTPKAKWEKFIYHEEADGRPIPYLYYKGFLADNLATDGYIQQNYALLIPMKEVKLYLPFFLDHAKNITVDEVLQQFTVMTNPYCVLAHLQHCTVVELHPLALGLIHHIQEVILDMPIVRYPTDSATCSLCYDVAEEDKKGIPPSSPPLCKHLLEISYEFYIKIPALYLLHKSNHELMFTLPLIKQEETESRSTYILRQVAILLQRLIPLARPKAQVTLLQSNTYYTVANILNLDPVEPKFPGEATQVMTRLDQWQQIQPICKEMSAKLGINPFTLLSLINWRNLEDNHDKLVEDALEALDTKILLIYNNLRSFTRKEMHFLAELDTLYLNIPMVDLIGQLSAKPLKLGSRSPVLPCKDPLSSPSSYNCAYTYKMLQLYYMAEALQARAAEWFPLIDILLTLPQNMELINAPLKVKLSWKEQIPAELKAKWNITTEGPVSPSMSASGPWGKRSTRPGTGPGSDPKPPPK